MIFLLKRPVEQMQLHLTAECLTVDQPHCIFNQQIENTVELRKIQQDKQMRKESLMFQEDFSL